MKTFKQYLEEQLWTTIKLPDGTFKRGPYPHSTHESIRDKHGITMTPDHEPGFLLVRDGKKTFLNRKEAAEQSGLGAKAGGRLDSTQIQDRSQINRDVDNDSDSMASHDAVKSNIEMLRRELEYSKQRR